MFTVKIMELLHTHRHTNPQKDIGEIRFIDILYMNHWDAMRNYMMVKTTFRKIHINFILFKWILYCIVLIFLLIWNKFKHLNINYFIFLFICTWIKICWPWVQWNYSWSWLKKIICLTLVFLRKIAIMLLAIHCNLHYNTINQSQPFLPHNVFFCSKITETISMIYN